MPTNCEHHSVRAELKHDCPGSYRQPGRRERCALLALLYWQCLLALCSPVPPTLHSTAPQLLAGSPPSDLDRPGPALIIESTPEYNRNGSSSRPRRRHSSGRRRRWRAHRAGNLRAEVGRDAQHCAVKPCAAQRRLRPRGPPCDCHHVRAAHAHHARGLDDCPVRTAVLNPSEGTHGATGLQ